MNKTILEELAAKWERKAKEPLAENRDSSDSLGNMVRIGSTHAYNKCAEELRTVLAIFA